MVAMGRVYGHVTLGLATQNAHAVVANKGGTFCTGDGGLGSRTEISTTWRPEKNADYAAAVCVCSLTGVDKRASA